jgi:hypothetical protein
MQATKRVTTGRSKPVSLAHVPTHPFGVAPPVLLGLHHKPDRLTEALISPPARRVDGARQPMGPDTVSHPPIATADREAVPGGRSYAQSPAGPAQVSPLFWSAIAHRAVVRAGLFRTWWRTWVPCSQRWSTPACPPPGTGRPRGPRGLCPGRADLECFAGVEDYRTVSTDAIDQSDPVADTGLRAPLGGPGTYHASLLPKALAFDQTSPTPAPQCRSSVTASPDLAGRRPISVAPNPSGRVALIAGFGYPGTRAERRVLDRVDWIPALLRGLPSRHGLVLAGPSLIHRLSRMSRSRVALQLCSHSSLRITCRHSRTVCSRVG